MAAYGALVSVMHIIDQLQTHPLPPISIDEKQIESLTQVITSLQEFLEGYSSHCGYTQEEDFWESRIAEAAYDAEDVIESYIVDQIRVRSRNDVENISSIQFYQGLEKVIDNMNLIKIEINEKMVVQDQLHIIKSVTTTAAADSSGHTSTAQNVTMIGVDDVLYQMLDKITVGEPDLQIIPIVGMDGIGKTTLGRNIYVSPLVQQHFDVCAWSTISQDYNAREILRQVLGRGDKGKGGDLSEDELGLHLHQYLIGRRYFIVMDDMWNIETWDKVRRFFPDNRNGSRIVATTRLSNLASYFNYSNGLDMKFLDEDASWNLFSKIVFGEESCPGELEDIGMKIEKGCKGLPLSVAVIGGLLSKSERTKENWGFIEKDLSSIVNLDDNERCLQVLYMSYDNLPVHLKPCFLYIGGYDKDKVIPICRFILFSLVAEGFVKPIKGKSLEEVAAEYIEELVDRNLLIVVKRDHYGKLKSCKVHDLLRDVCLREAQKLKFFCELGEQSIPQGINSQRRIDSKLWKYPTPLLESLESASLVRSFWGNCPKSLPYKFRLLRVSMFGRCSEEEKDHDYYEIFIGLVNLRLLVVDVNWNLPRIPSSVYFLWNLQTIFLYYVGNDYVFQIWKLPLLRHVITSGGTLDGAYCLPDPLSEEDIMVLKNLQTLYAVSNPKFGEGVLKRIPNIKKMMLYYGDTSSEEDDYRLNNLCCLHKLEDLGLSCSKQHSHLVREVSFPYSLKELVLRETYLPWEDMATKIGSLPLLQVLKLKRNSFSGSEWATSEDQFLNLKLLLIENCDVECWITDKTHFPRLERLNLHFVKRLREISSSIGDIPTLQSIKLLFCSASAVDSAQRIKEDQEEHIIYTKFSDHETVRNKIQG